MINEKAKKLAEAMVASKLLSAEELKKALVICAQKNSSSLMLVLLEKGALTFSIFEKFLTSNLGIKKAVLVEIQPDANLISKIGMEFIKTRKIFPIGTKESGGSSVLALGMVDPLDTETAQLVQNQIGFRVIPVLISLPDFINKVDPRSTTVNLRDQSDDKVVLIRPGGYEEEIAFRTKVSELTETMQESPLKGIKQASIEIETPGQFVSLGGTARVGRSIFIGKNQKKFKEEVLAKLELSSSDARIIKREYYTREVLINDLADVSLRPLEDIYAKLTDSQKLEALANALIKSQLTKRQDILVSGAVSYIFGEE